MTAVVLDAREKRIVIAATGTSTFEAKRYAEAAKSDATLASNAANSTLALANFYQTKAAGETGTTIGKYFSYPDPAGGLIYAERVATGTGDSGGNSKIFGRGVTQAYLEQRFAAIAESFTTAVLRAGRVEVDGQLYFTLVAGNPLWNFDPNDHLGYRRDANVMFVNIDGWTRMEVTDEADALKVRSDGALRTLRLSTDTDSSGRRIWVEG